MPLYEFECLRCHRHREVVLSIADRGQAPRCCYRDMQRIITAAHVSPDISPYRAVAGDKAGEYIGSRREHREYLKRNSLVEVGNEPVRPIKNNFRPRKGEIAAELKKVIPQVLSRYR